MRLSLIRRCFASLNSWSVRLPSRCSSERFLSSSVRFIDFLNKKSSAPLARASSDCIALVRFFMELKSSIHNLHRLIGDRWSDHRENKPRGEDAHICNECPCARTRVHLVDDDSACMVGLIRCAMKPPLGPSTGRALTATHDPPYLYRGSFL